MRKSASAILFLSVVASAPAGAQFVTPLPKPHDAQLAATGSLRRHLASLVDSIARSCEELSKGSTDVMADSLRSCRMNKENIQKLDIAASAYCEARFAGKYLDTLYVEGCKGSDDLYTRILREGTAAPRARYSPILEGRLGVVQLYGEAGDLRLLSKFAANVRADQIYVLTEAISGVVGIFPFGVTTASIVTREDSSAMPGLASDLTRLINNGGTVTARVGAPIFASVGTNVRTAFSVYTQGGLLGEITDSDSLHASGAFVLEGVGGLAIRTPDTTAEHKGDLLVGVRLARAWKESAFGPAPLNRTAFGYAQFAVGLVQGQGTLGVSVLITKAFNRDVDGLIPRMAVNLSANR